MAIPAVPRLPEPPLIERLLGVDALGVSILDTDLPLFLVSLFQNSGTAASKSFSSLTFVSIPHSTISCPTLNASARVAASPITSTTSTTSLPSPPPDSSATYASGPSPSIVTNAASHNASNDLLRCIPLLASPIASIAVPEIPSLSLPTHA
eukprot:CAMPEP_0174892296 /NCGR_PEP_ID=MMETSP0167-20121228/7275_1 /TAXON_ID=38298 /ORGANISM="Rhodella maculata, Strain CCMP736" /LENGTH=150 /DNA_ID=CAMNT_0016130745 /DNA_START=508 /DNA_END=957 /DNA_ORIENTATION=+